MQFVKYLCYPVLGLLLLSLHSCKKQDDFLNTKPNEALAVPSTLADLQSLLQNEGLFNIHDPGLGEIASDDFYVPDYIIGLLTTQENNGYLWAQQVYDAGADIPDWSLPYQQIYYANTVLDDLPKISYNSNQQSLYNQIKGTALFYRAIAFYNLVQTFALPYDSTTAGSDLGVPLRLSSDLNIKSTRATEKQCYDQIIEDLQNAVSSLPITAAYKTEPSQIAANALLARVYLAIGYYSQSFRYANASLNLYHSLTDYNTLKPGGRSLATSFLSEDIYHTRPVTYDIAMPNDVSIVDSTLYHSYVDNDLRKTLFFGLSGGSPYFRGSYDYKGYDYDGIATDEIYLIRAECYARLGNTDSAMNDLNTLLITRWKTGTFVPYTAPSADDALKQILNERRKELIDRGLRWIDLRRLNKESRFAITLVRQVKGITYTLPPNDLRYAWPIPDNEIQMSGISQNAR
jgi:tetratricopeptide (TPR) repeat protein